MVDVNEDLHYTSDENETDEFSSGDEFWFKAGQNSSNTSTEKTKTNQILIENESNSSEICPPSISKMAELMKKTLKFDDDRRSKLKKKNITKFAQIEAVTCKFVSIRDDFTTETAKLLECLSFLCDDERCATCFVQNKGLARLRDVIRRFTVSEFYWTKYKLDATSGNLHNFVGRESVRLLERLSRFQSTHSYIEKSELTSLIVNILDPMNAFFPRQVPSNDANQEKFQISLTKMNADKILTFVRRSLPVASFPVSVYLFDPQESSVNFIDSSSYLPYSFHFLSDLINDKTEKTKKIVRIVNLVDACTFWAIDDIDQKRILLEVLKICGTNAVTQLGYCKEMPSIGDLLMAPGDKASTGVAPIYRCIILERLDLDSVVIFAMDFGFFAKVSWKLLRKMNDVLKKLPAAAFLCAAKDAVPTPDDAVFMQLFAIIENLSVSPFIAESFARNDCSMDLSMISRKSLNCDEIFRKFWMSTECLNKNDCISTLVNLLKLPVDVYDSILFHALNVCCHFSAHSRIREKLNKLNLVEMLLDLSLKIVELCKFDESKSFLLLPLVNCLTNLCKDSYEGRKTFEKCNGLVLPASLTMTYPENHDLHFASKCLLQNVFTEKINAENFAETIENLERRQIPTNENDYLENFLNETVRLKFSTPSGIRLTEKILRLYKTNLESKDRGENVLEPSKKNSFRTFYTTYFGGFFSAPMHVKFWNVFPFHKIEADISLEILILNRPISFGKSFRI